VTLLSAWALAGLLLAVPLILAYLRRPRPPVRDVSSLLPWLELREGSSAPRGRHGRRAMLPPALLLQLLVLALIVLGLAQPAGGRVSVRPTRTYVIDDSPWMQASEGGETRLLGAERLVRGQLRRLASPTTVRLVLAGAVPSLRFSGSPQAAATAIGQLAPGDGAADLDAGLRLAAGLPRAASDRVILLRAPEDPAPAVRAAAGTFTQLVVGHPLDDQGLIAGSARCGLPAPAACELFARVRNTGPSTSRDRVEVLLAGQPVSTQTVSVARDSSSPVLFRVPAATDVEMRLAVHDALPSDDTLFVAVPASQPPVRVTLVGRPSSALAVAAALHADPGVQLTLRTPSSYRASDARTSELLVLDGWMPAGALPRAPSLMLLAPPRLPGALVAGTLADSRISGSEAASALLTGVGLASLTIEPGAARRISLPSWMTAAAWSPDGPLLASGATDGQRVALLAFEPFRSNLTQLQSFPQLIANLVSLSQQWAPAQATPGQPILIQEPPGTSSIVVSTSGGTSRPLAVDAGTAQPLTPRQPGIETITQRGPWGMRAGTLAVNVDTEPVSPPTAPVELAATASPAAPARAQWWPWLLGGALIALLLEWLHAAGRESGLPRRRALLAIRSASLALLGLALAQPQIGHGSGGPETLVVDRSASIAPSAARSEQAWLRANNTSGCGSECRIVQFAGVAQLSAQRGGLLPASIGGALDGEQTSLQSALTLAVAHAPAGGQLVLLSDGLQTRGQAGAVAAEARAKHVRIDVVALADGNVDAAVTSIHAPATLHAGDPLSLQVTVRSTRASQATLSLSRDGQPLGRQRVQLKAGENPFLFALHAGAPGSYAYEATVTMSGDSVAENNTLTTTVRVGAEPAVLVAGTGSAIAGMLRTDGMRVSAIEPDRLPSTPGAYAGEDAVVLDDVSAAQIGEARAAALAGAVRSGTVGLLALGGRHSFSLGGYYSSRLQQALPVSSLEPGQLRQRQLGVELILDRSGSMVDEAGGVPKLEMAQLASKDAASFLAANGDQLGIVDFDAEPHTLAPVTRLAPGRSLAGIDRRIEGLVAEGGTNIYAALADGARQIEASDARDRRIVLITDGVSEPGSYASLLPRLRAEHITVSTVALGEEADFTLLKAIATSTGGSYYATDNAAELPRIFAKDTRVSARPVSRHGRITVTPGGSSPILASLSGTVLEPLHANVITTLKQGAQADLVAEDPGYSPAPALAQWQYGAGRAVSWTPGLEPDLAGAWAERPQLWREAVRWVERGVAVPALTPSIAPDSNSELELDTAQSAGVAIDQETLAGQLQTETGKTTTLRFSETAPSRYLAAAPSLSPGAYRYTVSAAGKSSTGLLAVPYPAEYRPAPVEATPLGSLAAETQGRVLGVRNPRGLGRHRSPEWRWAALAALLCFLAGVMLGLRQRRGEDPPQTRVRARGAGPIKPSADLARS
jgi:Ca-activated chloride channel family protein